MLGLRPSALCRAATALLAAASFASVPASADPTVATARTSSLSWERGPGAEACADAEAIERKVEARLGRDVFVAAERAEVALRGRVERAAPTGFRAKLALAAHDGAPLGEREIASAEPTCDALGEQLALVIAVMIDPEGALAGPEARPEPAATPSPEPAPTEAPSRPSAKPAAPLPVAPPAAPRSARVEAGVAFGFGAQPGAGVGATVLAALQPRGFWETELSATLWRDAMAEATASTGSRVSLVHGRLAVCPWVFGRGGLAGVGCAGFVVGAWSAEGVGFRVNEAATEVFIAVDVAARARARLAGPFFGELGLSLGAPLRRQRIRYRRAGEDRDLFQVWPVVATTELTVGVEMF